MELKSLPLEIQEEIFDNLCHNDLLNMLLVDRHTKNLIENSPRLMSHLPIIITDDDDYYDYKEKSIELLMYANRKTSKIIVKLKRSKIMNYLSIFKKFSDTIQYLVIEDYSFESIDQMRLVLRYIYNLKSLTLSNVLFIKPENKFLNSIVQLPSVSLLKLREINCVDTDLSVFTLFTNNFDIQLRQIRVKCDSRSSAKCLDFCQVMSQQVLLVSMTLDSVTSQNYANLFDYGDFLNCQLKILEISNCELNRVQMRVLIKMIKNQTELQQLKVINTQIPSSMDVVYVYRQLFASSSIKEVHLDITNLLSFHSHNLENFSVQHLTIYGNFAFENLPIFINVIKIFPNTIRLKLIGDMPISDKYLFHILATFMKLKELSIPGFTSRRNSNFSNLACLDAVKLETLILDYIDYDVKFFEWKNIVSFVNSIEKLVIKRDYCNVSNEIVDIIIKKLKLKHLELGCGVASEEIMLNIAYNEYCSDLRILKVSKSDFVKVRRKIDFRRLFDKNRLLFHVCCDEYFMR